LTSTRHSPDDIIARLRRGQPPIIARIVNDKVIADLRTVRPGEDEILARGITAALAGDDLPVERS
jgi:seryl-tRNA(Sec) selenium transferase